MRRILLSSLFVLLLSLTACMPPAPPAAPPPAADALTPQPITLGLGFIPSVQFAPIYVGMEKGFFAEEGIDLSLEYGFENDYLRLVGTGAMQFLIGSGDQVALGAAQGLPVRYVMAWYSRYPVTIFARAEAGIVEPADLAGKRVGVPGPFGATYIGLRGILQAAGLDEADIQMQSIGFTQAAAVSEGIVDAAADYAVNGPVVLGLAGIETTQIDLDPYLTIPANGLITNLETLAQEPELVRSMIRAIQRANDYTLANPDEAFQIALDFVPEAGGENEAANRAIFDASLAYWQPRSDGPAGSTLAPEWQAALDLLLDMGLIERLVPAQDLFTNDYLPSSSAP
jgi:NitT/TauT family transport system substrate-binding protein